MAEEEEKVNQDVHPMSREEDHAQIHDEQETQEEHVAQGAQENVEAPPIPEDNGEDKEGRLPSSPEGYKIQDDQLRR